MIDPTENLLLRCRQDPKWAHEEIMWLREFFDPEAFLVSTGKPAGSERGYEFVVKSPMALLLAHHMAAILKAYGAENYVEIRFSHDELGPLTLVVQRVNGDTPGQKAAQRETEMDRLRSDLAQLHCLDVTSREGQRAFAEWRNAAVKSAKAQSAIPTPEGSEP